MAEASPGQVVSYRKLLSDLAPFHLSSLTQIWHLLPLATGCPVHHCPNDCWPNVCQGCLLLSPLYGHNLAEKTISLTAAEVTSLSKWLCWPSSLVVSYWHPSHIWRLYSILYSVYRLRKLFPSLQTALSTIVQMSTGSRPRLSHIDDFPQEKQSCYGLPFQSLAVGIRLQSPRWLDDFAVVIHIWENTNTNG